MSIALTMAARLLLMTTIGQPAPDVGAADAGLVAHWPLAGDLRDRSGHGLDAEVRGTVDLDVPGRDGKPRGAVGFGGRGGLVVPANPCSTWGTPT